MWDESPMTCYFLKINKSNQFIGFSSVYYKFDLEPGVSLPVP